MFKLGGVKAIHHLLFVDDVLLFEKENMKTLIRLFEAVINTFCEFRGKETNMNKRGIMFSKPCQNKNELQDIMQISKVAFQMKYLGLPLVTWKSNVIIGEAAKSLEGENVIKSIIKVSTLKFDF